MPTVASRRACDRNCPLRDSVCRPGHADRLWLGGPDGGLEERGQGPGRRPQQLCSPLNKSCSRGREAYVKVLSEDRGRIVPDDERLARQVRYILGKLVQRRGLSRFSARSTCG